MSQQATHRDRSAHARTLACLASALLVGHASGQQFDWRPTFNGAGTGSAQGNRFVRSITAAPGANGAEQAFVCGSFDSISGCVAPTIARFDGATFSVVPGQLGGSIETSEMFQGQLHVAGALTIAGAPAIAARFDGAQWHPLLGSQGQTLSQPAIVLDLLVHDDGSGEQLYAIGWFNGSAGLSASNIARWDGAEWSPVGDGFDSICEDGALWDDGSGAKLYVTGFFDFSGGNPIKGVARWNGASWEAVGVGGPGTGYTIGAYSHPTNGGVFVSGSGPVRRFDGANWSSVGAHSIVEFLEFDDGSSTRFLGASASQLLEWDGQQWNALADVSGGSGGLKSLAAVDFGALGGRRLLVGGGFSTLSAASLASPLATRGLALFDGLTWSAAPGSLALGLDNNVRALARFDDGRGEALYAGGDFLTAGAVSANRVARWDGASWEALGVGVSGAVEALATHDDGAGEALYVGGNFNQAGGAPASRVARWDGSNWSALGSGLNGSTNALVSFDDGSGPALIAGGQFNTFFSAPGVARWDGVQWSPMGNGLAGEVHALAVANHGSGPQLYAGGSFSTSGGAPMLFLARWNGANWVSVGGGLDGAVFSLLGDGADLYVGGEFAGVDGGFTPLASLARWNGAAWSQVCVPWPNGRVQALAMFDEGAGPKLFVGGRFTFPASRIGRVDGGALVALGGSVDWHVAALASFDDGHAPSAALYAGGPFESAGAFASQHIARWADGVVTPPTSYCTAGTTTNGCQALIGASGEPSRCSSAPFEITVGGVEGQKTGILFFGYAPTNSHWGLGSSFVCVAPPTTRASTQTSGGTAGACDGAFQLDFNAWMAANSLRAPLAGDQAYVQAWFRDPGSPKATSLSNALQMTIAP